MRDSNRLDYFYDEFCKLHKVCFPDLRFGQLCSNFFGWLMNEHHMDLFFPEENRMLDYFKEYCQIYNPTGYERRDII